MSNNIEKFWDVCHERGVVSSLTGSPYLKLMDNTLNLMDHVIKGNKVLEIGPGLGYVTQGLYGDGMLVSCLDISKIALERVTPYCEKTYTVEELHTLPSDYFDLIICVNVVQHVPTDSLIKEIKHCMRSLKVGGVFVVEFVSCDYAEDTGLNASLEAVKGGVCCRTVAYMEKLFNELGGVCKLISDIKCDSSGITGCHTFHVKKESI